MFLNHLTTYDNQTQVNLKVNMESKTKSKVIINVLQFKMLFRDKEFKCFVLKFNLVEGAIICNLRWNLRIHRMIFICTNNLHIFCLIFSLFLFLFTKLCFLFD